MSADSLHERVENMSYFLCDECGKRHELFGTGGAEAKATPPGGEAH